MSQGNGEMAGASDEPRKPQVWARGWFLTGAVVLFIGLGAIAILLVPQLFAAQWRDSLGDEKITVDDIRQAGQLVLLALGGTIAVVGVAVSLSRHGQELRAAERDRSRLSADALREQTRQAEVDVARQRETERDLRSRFASAVELVSGSTSSLRIAGLYSLAALADDWAVAGFPTERQVCVDVICAHLRNIQRPLRGKPSASDLAEKRAALQIITDRLVIGDDGNTGWTSCYLDLRGMTIDWDIDINSLALTERGCLDLTGATIEGDRSLRVVGLMCTQQAGLSLRGFKVDEGARVEIGGLNLHGDSTLTVGVRVATNASVTIAADLNDQCRLNLSENFVDEGGLLNLNSVHLAMRAHGVVQKPRGDGFFTGSIVVADESWLELVAGDVQTSSHRAIIRRRSDEGPRVIDMERFDWSVATG